jgi:hypothetical protein
MRVESNELPKPFRSLNTQLSSLNSSAMLVIRRMVDRRRSYTGIFLPGEPPRIFPTTDHEHGRILQIYKQDKPYEGIVNDFTEDPPSPPKK